MIDFSVFMLWFGIFIILVVWLVSHIFASMKINELGGNGWLYFFFSALYILCSNEAEDWPKFHKWIAAYLSFSLVGLTVYILTYEPLSQEKSEWEDRADRVGKVLDATPGIKNINRKTNREKIENMLTAVFEKNSFSADERLAAYAQLFVEGDLSEADYKYFLLRENK